MGVQLRYQPFDAAVLMNEPSPAQLRILEYIAEGFVENGREWIIWDYVQGRFDAEGVDVWAELRALPRHPQGYWAVGLPTNRVPSPADRVPLTILGIFQAEVMGRVATGLDRAFLLALNVMAKVRRDMPRMANTPRSFKITATELLEQIGHGDPRVTAEGLWDLLGREPPTWGGSREESVEEPWTREITREVLPFVGVTGTRDYLDRLVLMLTLPLVEAPPAAPSPLGLVGAIDYLDAIWRLAQPGAGHLFRLHSAQAIAQLAFGANTGAEFQSRLSGLGDVLRSFQLPPNATVRLAKKDRNKPLAAIEAHLVGLLPESGRRIGEAIAILHDVIAVRDAGQHGPASGRGAKALAALGVGYPPASWPEAWAMVAAKTIQALDALREELATLT